MDTSTQVEDTGKNSAANKRKIHSYRPFRKTKNDKSIIETTKFLGMCTAPSEYVYACSGAGQAEKYTKTTDKIAEYLCSKYTMGFNIRTAIETLNASTLAMPNDPGANATRTELFMWQENVKLYMRKLDQLSEYTKKTYSLVWGQCSQAMWSRVEEAADFLDIALYFDPIRLLTDIKLIAFNVQSHHHLPVAIYKTLRSFTLSRQGRNDSVQMYNETFCSHIQVVDEASGGIAVGYKLYNVEITELAPTGNNGNHTIAQKRLAKASARENYLAICFIMGADKARYWKYLEDPGNDFLKGRNDYPATLNDAYGVLSNYKTAKSDNKHSAGKDGVAFVLDGLELSKEKIYLLNTEEGNEDEAAARHKRNLKFMKCYNCNKRGHLVNDSKLPKRKPDAEKDSTTINTITTSTTDTKSDSTTAPMQTGTTSLMAAVEWGEYDGRGQGWQFATPAILCMGNRDTCVTLTQNNPWICI